MRELLDAYTDMSAGGQSVGRAVVIAVWGSAPRRPGAAMLATASGRIAGSVSGGCVEAAAAAEIGRAIASSRSTTVEYGVSDDTAWSVGLSCGGTIRLLIEPRVRPEVLERLEHERPFVAATSLGGAWPLGSTFLCDAGGVLPLPAPGDSPTPSGHAVPDALRRAAQASLESETSGIVTVPRPEGGTTDFFCEVYAAAPTLVVFGGVHIAAALVPMAKQLGFRTVVADARETYLNRERFPDADQLVHGWPADAFERVPLGRSTYVCVLTHDPKLDDPAVRIALEADAAYVGVIGSRRTQEARRERLLRAGLAPAHLERLRGPIGLPIGATEPAEIAVAILAEMTQTRRTRERR